jgi:redox-sensitive bicupin YhaK (pirin superfamily)
MIQIRKSKDRGEANHGWLKSRHTFSFGDYHDARFSGFHDLLVINEDRVAPGEGFGTHGHKDMEIISYVLAGALEHKDSLGTGSVLKPGDVQRMSAGKGVRHSEFNHSKTEGVHFLQIWITPMKMGITADYEEKRFTKEDKKNQLKLVISPDGQKGSLQISQNAYVYASLLDADHSATHTLTSGRHAWLQVASGQVEVNGNELQTGDGAAIEDEEKLTILARENSELLLFDLP